MEKTLGCGSIQKIFVHYNHLSVQSMLWKIIKMPLVWEIKMHLYFNAFHCARNEDEYCDMCFGWLIDVIFPVEFVCMIRIWIMCFSWLIGLSS